MYPTAWLCIFASIQTFSISPDQASQFLLTIDLSVINIFGCLSISLSLLYFVSFVLFMALLTEAIALSSHHNYSSKIIEMVIEKLLLLKLVTTIFSVIDLIIIYNFKR